jgi:hypothetical protein
MNLAGQIGVVAGALLVSALLGWLITGGVLRLADRAGRRRPAVDPSTVAREVGPDGAVVLPAVPGPDSPHARARLRGGTWIGVLERLAVTGTLLAGEPGGIAVVVAVKGLGRYPELRNGDDPAVSERFVIGTLTSLLWSAAIGLAGRWLLTR